MTAAPHPRMHGLTHVVGGPDPIPGLGGGGGALAWEDVGTVTTGVVLMDTTNTGDWITIDTRAGVNGGILLEGKGLTLSADQGATLTAGTSLALHSGTGTLSLITSNAQIDIHSGSGQTVTVNAPAGFLELKGGVIDVLPEAGGSLTVYKSNGFQAFRVDASGGVHIQSGTAILADLPAG